MKSIHSIIIALFVVFITPVIATADDRIEDNGGYCQNAQTTADLVACSSIRLQAENERLQQLFNAVLAVYEDDDEMARMIATNQKNWVSYRNTVCAVEGKQFEGGSLGIVQERSCLGRVTADRSNHFLVMLRARDDSAMPVFSNPPRWVNVLGADYKDIFWSLGSKKYVDTDCDGADEVLLSGVRMTDNGDYETVWAIADSQKTGRPTVSLLNSNDTKKCGLTMDTNIQLNPIIKPSIKTNQNAQCRETVSFESQTCGEFTLHHDGGTHSYQLINQNINEAEE